MASQGRPSATFILPSGIIDLLAVCFMVRGRKPGG
jgi:hypothetical protein